MKIFVTGYDTKVVPLGTKLEGVFHILKRK